MHKHTGLAAACSAVVGSPTVQGAPDNRAPSRRSVWQWSWLRQAMMARRNGRSEHSQLVLSADEGTGAWAFQGVAFTTVAFAYARGSGSSYLDLQTSVEIIPVPWFCWTAISLPTKLEALLVRERGGRPCCRQPGDRSRDLLLGA